MLRRTSVLAIALLCAGCPDEAADCHNTLSCDPPDAAPTVIYVDDAGACDGVCVPAVVDSLGWSPVPFVLWQGSAGNLGVVQCPSYADNPSQVLYAVPDQAPISCPACACGPSTGACGLPETVTISASPVCPSDADAGVPSNPPIGWDGGCTASGGVAAVDCDGGPCLATVGSLLPVAGACVPSQAAPSKVVTWGMAAFGCAGEASRGTCSSSSDVCLPAPPASPPGFSICVSRQGDDSSVDCPAGYPHRSLYYVGAEDGRGCAACECGPPQGDACSAVVSLYSDDSCSTEVGAVTAESSGPMCVSVPAGSPLGSKQASAPIYTSGTCQPSGGEPTGSVVPSFPVTVCCQ